MGFHSARAATGHSFSQSLTGGMYRQVCIGIREFEPKFAVTDENSVQVDETLAPGQRKSTILSLFRTPSRYLINVGNSAHL